MGGAMIPNGGYEVAPVPSNLDAGTVGPKFDKTDPKIFHYSAPTNADKAAFEELTALWITVAETIDRLCPVSREKSLAITKLDECRFFANGAIVRRS